MIIFVSVSMFGHASDQVRKPSPLRQRHHWDKPGPRQEIRVINGACVFARLCINRTQRVSS
jgi:hypothetical protein